MAVPGIRDVSAGTARFGLAVAVSVVAGVLVAGLVMPLVAGAGVLAKTASQDFENLPSVLVQPLLPQQTKIVAADGKTSWRPSTRRTAPTSCRSRRSARCCRRPSSPIEDTRFYEHNGVDLRGLARALVSNAQGGAVQGGSTLTQQYVKNVLVLTATTDAGARRRDRPHPGPQAARDAAGPGAGEGLDQGRRSSRATSTSPTSATGRTARRRRRCATSACTRPQLTLPQAATLAGIVQSPVSYDPLTQPDPVAEAPQRRARADEPAGRHLRRRLRQGGGHADQDDAATRRRRPTGARTSIAPYFCNYVLKYIKSRPDLREDGDRPGRRSWPSGYTIRTTLDVKAQASAQQTLDNKVPITDKHGAAVSVVQPGTGNILVMAQNRIWGIGKGNQYTTYNYNVDRRTPAGRHRPADQLQRRRLPDRVDVQAVRARGRPRAAHPGQHADPRAGVVHPEQGLQGLRGARRRPRTPRSSTTRAAPAPTTCAPATWDVGQHLLHASWSSGPACARRRRSRSRWACVRADGGKFSVTPSHDAGRQPDGPAPHGRGLRHASPRTATTARRARSCPSRRRPGRPSRCPPPACKQVIDPSIADGVTAILKGVIDFGTGHAPRSSAGRPRARPAPPTST